MAQLEIRNLNFRYPGSKEALKNINLTVQSGEFLLIAGASGCGKTTLLRHIKPALRPHGELTGEILLDGTDVTAMDFRSQSEKIGYVMQDPEMQVVTDKVWHELAFGLENLGINLRTMRVRVAEAASFFGIQEWFGRDVATLSGGQKQLLCLACVMAMQPEIVLLDEPTSQLDPIAAGGFFDILRRINTELGTTVIITEHRTENLFPIVDRVAFMEGGSVGFCCRPRDAGLAVKKHSTFYPVLPAAMRLYSRLGGAGLKDGAPGGEASPVSVREGREYLKIFMENHAPAREGKARNLDIARKIWKENHAPAREGKAARDLSVNPGEGQVYKPLVSLKDVWFRYGRDYKDVLRGLCLDIPAGRLTCIVGGNGAGKSTALLTAAGIYKPYRGKVKYTGEKFFTGKKGGGRPAIAVLSQSPQSGFEKDSVREELENAARKYAADEKSIEEAVRLMQIEGILDRHPYDLSGGEIQRAAIAKLLSGRPQALFLDEATKGMDAYFKKRFGAILKELVSSGATVAIVSHDIEFCAEFADNCVMLFNGEAAAQGTPRQVFSGNAFYTTAANRIARGMISGVVGISDIVSAVRPEGPA